MRTEATIGFGHMVATGNLDKKPQCCVGGEEV